MSSPRTLHKEHPIRPGSTRALMLLAPPKFRYPPDATTPLHIIVPRLARETADAAALARAVGVR